MDGFHKVLVREKNPGAIGFVEVLEAREEAFAAKMLRISVALAIEQWARRMETRQKERFGEEFVIVGHQPMDFVTALMAVRYGHDPDFWPEGFTPADFERALGWERGRIPSHVLKALQVYRPPIAGGSELTDYMEAQLGNHLFRTQLTTTIAWAASTAYTVGTIRRAVTWNDTLFEVVAVSGTGTSGATEPVWNTTIGAETTDNPGANQVVWQAIKIGVPKRSHFIALFTAAPGETGGGTEVSGGSYARVQHAPTDANWNASTQVGGAGRIDNAAAITFPAPTANWGIVTDMADMTRLTGGNMTMYTPLTTAKTVNNGDPAPNFAIGAFDIDWS